MHLSIAIPAGDVILDTIVAPMNLFRMANSYARRLGIFEQDLFEIDLVAQTKQAVTLHDFFQVSPTASLNQIGHTDLIIIASLTGNIERHLDNNRRIIEWIRNQRESNGTEIVSLCRSAFVLAETGLLNGQSCATHWVVQDRFKTRYPEVNVLPEKIISEENGIYSSGGAYSFLNIVVYLIEKFYGRETAIWVSKMAEIDYDRVDQNQFVIFSGQKTHGDDTIREVQEYIEENYSEKLSVEALADRFAISGRTFIRRFKKATLNTPLEYIQRVKIEAAKRSFERSSLNISEVMYDVGYSDERAFRKTFRKFTGLSPLEYRRKYNRDFAFG